MDTRLRNRAAWRPHLHATRLRRGFNNDVRIIDLGHANSSGPFSGPWNRSIVAFWQFLVVLWGVIRGLVLFLLDRARRRVGDSRRERKSRQGRFRGEGRWGKSRRMRTTGGDGCRGLSEIFEG
jgi:hypothetical protein